MPEQAKPEFVREKKHLEAFERRFVDGLLCPGGNDRQSFLADFRSAGRAFPAVVVDNYFPRWDLDYVVSDYQSGAQQAMNYLVQLGHRHIGLIAAAQEITTSGDVSAVYRRKLADAHAQGFWVIVDGVFNHVGTACPFLHDVLKNGKDSKYADWFEVTDWGTGGPPGKPGGIQ